MQIKPSPSITFNEKVTTKLREIEEEIELIKCFGNELLCLSLSGN
jgi:predicted CoA-binding protein